MHSKLTFWKPIVGEDWYMNNAPLFDSPYMENLLGSVIQQYKTSTIFPAQKNVFRALKLTPFSDVRVLILGQDPYSTGPDNDPDATGLAFANPENRTTFNPSLRNIHKSVETSCYNGLKVDFDYTLEEWANQGVLLLNTALTVNKFKPGSHTEMWDGFTRYIIESLNKQKQGIHFVFWGNNAKAYSYLVNPLFHYVYEGTHPAYAARVGQEWDCTHFKDINNNLLGQNGEGETIIW